MNNTDMHKIANIARLRLLEQSEGIKNRIHWGSSFSLMEIVTVLFTSVCDDTNDVFILSKGHGAPGVYSILYEIGKIDKEIWNSYGESGSPLSELMEFNPDLGFTCSGGSLGLGLSYGEGIALRKKKKNEEGRVYVLLGDGEVNEGSVWEAIASAAHYKLDNLNLIIDRNRLQSDGSTDVILKLPDFKSCLEIFGWIVYETDGHDCKKLLKIFEKSPIEGKPTAIICNTVKGKGVSFMEDNPIWHDNSMSQSEFDIARKELTDRVANQ